MAHNNCSSQSRNPTCLVRMAHNSGRSCTSTSHQRSAGDVVAGNDDLLMEILFRLPVKPLTQFKCVSKRWLSLISDPQFSHHHRRRNRKPVSALFLCSLRTKTQFSFVPFDDSLLGATHFQFLDQPGTIILHSCNGLLCYSKSDDSTDGSILGYYVCNPTTKRSTKIPLLGLVHNCRIRRGYFRVTHKLGSVKTDELTKIGSGLKINLLGIYLAFDPLKSAHYRVVCVWEWDASVFNYQIQIAVYRSEIGLWGEPVGPFTVPYAVCFDNGVFFNGIVNWMSNIDIVYFDVDGGCLKIMSSPLISRGSNVLYFGDSHGHLHLVVDDKTTNALLNVLEMEKDYSGWFVKYCCDLGPMIAMPTEMHSSYMSCKFSLIFLGRGEKEDESHLVLAMYGELISYNLKDKTTKKLCNLPPFLYEVGWAQSTRYKAFGYEEALSGV